MRLAFSLLLVAAPGSGALTGPIVSRARRLLAPDAVFEDRWLAPGEAWQALFSADASEEEDAAPDEALAIRAAAVAALADEPIDVNVVSSDLATSRKRLLVADMESTIIEEEMLDEIAACVGLGDTISDITARAMRGELAFEGALKERVAMLAGLDAKVLDELYERRVHLMPGAEVLLATMKAAGAATALVSGGFTLYTERIAARLGFDHQQANVLEIAGGLLTGRVVEPILGREAKREALLRLAAEKGHHIALTLAVGDGANDLAMISAAGLGVAFRAKPKVQEAARSLPNGAVVTHGDLTSLLYLQGYRKDEFVN